MRSAYRAPEGAASTTSDNKSLKGRSRQIWTVHMGVPKLRLYRPGDTPTSPKARTGEASTKTPRSSPIAGASLSTQAIMALLAHSARLSQMRALAEAGEDGLTFGQIAQCCGLPTHRVSYHLKMLRKAGILTVRRQGRTFFFTLASAAVEPLWACLSEIEAIVRPIPKHRPLALPMEHQEFSRTSP